MNAAISITKTVFGAIQIRLAALSFERLKPGIFATKLSDDVNGWIGLNTATRGQKGFLEINPVVGVRNQRVERLVAELVGEVFNELIPPTIAGNVGYLSPANSYLPFLFTEDMATEEVTNQLCDAVKTHGLPFMRKVADLAALVEAMQTLRFGVTEQLNYRIPVGLVLLADNQRAKAFLAAKVREIGARNDPAALRYKGFAAKLSDRLES